MERTLLYGKLARRVFWLFVLCALLPLAVFSIVVVLNVSAQLSEQNRRLLRQTSRESAMSILEHLNFLDADMRLIATSVETGTQPTPNSAELQLPPKLGEHLRALEILTPDGGRRLISGKMEVVYFSPEERVFLGSGKSVVSTRSCATPAPCIYLAQELAGQGAIQGILVGEVDASHLWGQENLPPLIDICVLDDQGRTLFCPQADSSQFPIKTANTFSGQFEWSNHGNSYLSDYWSVPLKPHFFVSHWTVVASEARSDVLAPLSHFKRIFLLTVLLAFWVVILLSLIQIRRNMVPLTRLQEGTRRLTRGDLRARVTVPGTDEFAELASSFNFMADRIEKQVTSLKTINEIDRAILSSWNMERVVDALIERLPDLIKSDCLGITLLNAGSTLDAVTYVAAPNAVGGKQVQAVTLSAREAGALINCPEITTLEVAKTFPSYLALLVQLGMHYFLVVPIVLKGKLSAIISLGHKTDSVWGVEDKQQAAQLADQVAVAISNARLIAELKQVHWGTLTALARAIDAKSSWTAGHSERVTKWALKIACAMSLPEQEQEIIHRGGLLHDIGKIGTPLAILDKPGKLTDEETQVMRDHVRVGARILEPIPGFEECMPIVLQHHEWINGGGYPNGLAGEQISLHARIFAVADCFDAMVSDRPYRPGMALDRVVEIIGAGTGKQFDPAVVEAFLQVLKNENKSDAVENAALVPIEFT
jgi:putative nucleotidyltransferase with HDIG domain